MARVPSSPIYLVDCCVFFPAPRVVTVCRSRSIAPLIVDTMGMRRFSLAVAAALVAKAATRAALATAAAAAMARVARAAAAMAWATVAVATESARPAEVVMAMLAVLALFQISLARLVLQIRDCIPDTTC